MTKRGETHRRAYRRAGAKLSCYIHLVVYIPVNLLLVFINYSTTPQYLWFQWPLLGWGIGLVFHWLAVFIGPTLMERSVKRELEKDRSGE